MMADLPHTLFKDKKEKGKPSQTEIDDAVRLQEEANKKAMERRAKAKETESYTIDEVFAGKADMDEKEK